MKVLVLTFLGFCFAALPYASAATFEGTLVDANCYLKNSSFTGNDHGSVKGCGTVCLKSGLPAGILTKDKEFHILVTRGPALAPYVGQEVKVEGALEHGAIEVQKVQVQKNGNWEEVNLKAMM